MCGIQTDFMFHLSLLEAYNRKKKKKKMTSSNFASD